MSVLKGSGADTVEKNNIKRIEKKRRKDYEKDKRKCNKHKQ